MLPNYIMGNLKEMNLSRSAFLTTTPCFSEVPNLEILRLNWCWNLSNIDPSIGLLQKLINLGLLGCEKLKRLPSSITKLKSLEILNVHYCFDLEGLPEQLGDMKSLRYINASESGIKELPDSIGLLDKLTALHLGRCRNIKRFPKRLGDMKSLINIDVSRSGIKELPDSIGLLDKLHILTLESCDNLQCLPSTIANLKLIEDLNVSKCSELEELPEHLGDMKRLKRLDASGTRIKKLPDSIGDLCELSHLKLSGCKFLKSLPNSIGNMTSLEFLHISGTAIEKLHLSIGLLIHLQFLYFDNCNLSDGVLLDNLQKLSSLKELCLSRNNFCTLPSSLARLSNLKYLNVSRNNFEVLPSFVGHLSHLEILSLSGNSFCTLPSSIAQLSNLVRLQLDNCRSLRSVLDLSPNLKVLSADDCTSLEKLSVGSNYKLLEIYLRNCSSLVEIQGLENVINSVYEIHLEGCSSFFSTTATEIFLLQEPSEVGIRKVRLVYPFLFLSRQDIPDCFEYKGMGDSAICFDVPLCVPDDFYHFFIWFDCEFKVDDDDGHRHVDYIGIHVTNKTRDSEWGEYYFDGHCSDVSFAGSCVIHLRCDLEIKGGDSIEVSFKTYGLDVKVVKSKQAAVMTEVNL